MSLEVMTDQVACVDTLCYAGYIEHQQTLFLVVMHVRLVVCHHCM